MLHVACMQALLQHACWPNMQAGNTHVGSCMKHAHHFNQGNSMLDSSTNSNWSYSSAAMKRYSYATQCLFHGEYFYFTIECSILCPHLSPQTWSCFCWMCVRVLLISVQSFFWSCNVQVTTSNKQAYMWLDLRKPNIIAQNKFFGIKHWNTLGNNCIFLK